VKQPINYSWVANTDEFGISYRCDVCGHNEFYKDEVPPPCPHKPAPYEVKMHEDRIARKAACEARAYCS